MSADETLTNESEEQFEARHASNLELFLDLVFVFAITQIALLIGHDLTAAGTARGLLIALLMWWQWSQFTWAGSVADLQKRTGTRVLVLCMIPATLLVTIAIPDAFHERGIWFAAAYFGVQVLVLVMQGVLLYSDAASRRGFRMYLSMAALTPIAVLIGGLAHGDARVAWWTAAVVVNVIGSILGASRNRTINPSHFAERHSLFIIIALGEVVVAAGATASGGVLDRDTTIAIVVCVAVACAQWWTYFAFVPAVGEHLLAAAKPNRRGPLARDFFTFGHFPLVAGLVMFSVVVEHLIEHPTESLEVADRWLLALSVLAFTGGLFVLKLRVTGKGSPDRVATIVVAGLLCWAGAELSGVVVVGGIATLYAVAQGFRYARFRREDLGSNLITG